MIERIHAADPTVFLKARAALEEGRVLVVFVDYVSPSGGPTLISPNLFAWADAIGIPLLHMLALLDEEGRIRIELAVENGETRGARHRARQFLTFVEARWRRRFAICRPKDVTSHFPVPAPVSSGS
ncbi:hypothetical protein [Flavisphingomonas formosensis]|uniref:hypothetical protein n=1 Tax=Flavisphingomonas formosensis TaxID=861534 RepID=UPI0012F95AB1|nr:hypothetical protein [Sphingomonas formosensis]